jgi:hypothetical protein
MIMPGDRDANAASALIKSQWLGKEFTFTSPAMLHEMLGSLRFRSVRRI